MDTESIFALATHAGRAGIAVFRISGPLAQSYVAHVTHQPVPPPRKAVCRKLQDAGELIDDALVLWFPGPASFTGEDVAGGVWIVGVWGTGAFTGAPAAACAQRGADIDSKMVADKLRTLARNCM